MQTFKYILKPAISNGTCNVALNDNTSLNYYHSNLNHRKKIIKLFGLEKTFKIIECTQLLCHCTVTQYRQLEHEDLRLK